MKVKIYLLITVLVVMSILPGCQDGDSVAVEDPNLEQVIRQVLGRPHGPLSSRELMGITGLDGRNREIRSLEGIETLVNLRSLCLDDNRLTDVSPLAGLTKLETLTLRGNQISDLSPLAGLTLLQELDLRDNRVADASPLAHLTNLVDLNLRGNGIEDISFLSQLKRLRVLNLRENEISDISVLANLTLLEDLNLRHNRVADVSPLAELGNLTVRLYLEGNPVSNFRPLRYVLENTADIDIAFAIGDPDFSVMGGFYEEPFQLKLSTYRPQGVIWYTLDGSEPDPINNRASSHEYKGPISIGSRSGEPNLLSAIRTTYHFWQGPPKGEVFKATTVRARVFVDNQPCGDIQTHTYFVDPEIRTRYTMPVLSVVTDPDGLFDDKIGIYVPGDRYVEGNERTGNYWTSGLKWEREAHLEFFESDGRFGFAQGVGIRIHGGITRAWPQKTLRIYARREYGPDKIFYDLFPGHYEYDVGFERVLLRNGGNDMRRAFMRDALIHRLVQHTGLDTQAWRPVILFINGEYWGIHNLRERVDQHYLNGKYGVNKEQVVILEGNAVLVQGPATGPRHYKDMLDFVRNNSMAVESNYRYVQSLMDTDNYIDYMITEIWSANTDWPHNNIRFWRIQAPEDQLIDMPGHDGRWRWLVYDLDYGLGLAEEPSHNSLSRVVNSEDWTSVLINRLLKNQEFRTEFINRFADHLNYTFAPQRVNQFIDEMAAIYRPEMEEHLQRWPYTSSVRQWEKNVEEIRAWVSARPKYVREHLINQFKLAGQAELTISAQGGQGTIKINSMSFSAQDMPWTGIYFKGIPVTIEAVPGEGYVFVGWEGTITSTDPRQTLNLSGDTSLRAVFAPAR
jgi:hypothetical protein